MKYPLLLSLLLVPAIAYAGAGQSKEAKNKHTKLSESEYIAAKILYVRSRLLSRIESKSLFSPARQLPGSSKRQTSSNIQVVDQPTGSYRSVNGSNSSNSNNAIKYTNSTGKRAIEGGSSNFNSNNIKKVTTTGSTRALTGSTSSSWRKNSNKIVSKGHNWQKNAISGNSGWTTSNNIKKINFYTWNGRRQVSGSSYKSSANLTLAPTKTSGIRKISGSKNFNSKNIHSYPSDKKSKK